MVNKMGSNMSMSSVSSKTSLQPSHVAGGYEYLKSLGKSSRSKKELQQYDSGPLDDDISYLEDALAAATVAAIKCEWERVGTWDQFECPADVLRQRTPALMKQELEKATQNYVESNIPANLTKSGRGRGKAKGTSKKFAVVLGNAMTILSSVVDQKNKELSTRKQAYSAVTEYETSKVPPCTCWYSSSDEVVCKHCRRDQGTKNEVSHTVTLRKNSRGKLGLRFHGDWAPILTEIKHGFPAADVTELERFLEHRVSHVNGKPIGGSAQLLKVIASTTTNTVVMGFYHRMLDYNESSRQYQIQLKSGRGPPIPIGPSKEEIQLCKDKNKQLKTNAIKPVVEIPQQREESLVATMRRRWTAARHDQLNLENMAATTEDRNMNTGLGLFRFVTSTSQRNAISEQASAALLSQSESIHSGHPPPGIFSIHDIRSFYPPLLSPSKRKGVKLSRAFQKASQEIESFIRNCGSRLDCFVVVVDEAKHGAPKYYEVIPEPVDFSTVTCRINNVLYESIDQIKADCDTIWQNCRRYNPDHHWLHKASLDLERELDISWESHLSSVVSESTSTFSPVAKPTSSTPAGKVFSRLAEAPPYSSSYFKITDYLDTVPNSYNLCAEPCPDNPQLTDIVVELNPSKITEQVSKNIIAMLDRNKLGADDDVGGRRKTPKYG
eukprot:TRINITY_DN3207_c2_g1_i1.p1 TRINITY_DN3207_c2_g1~~TRINITY_DN3207_c2_g1_i1.p1  ORF type:complete len:665 (+),score=100.15 TRINITY_DN3207_c2_g1_i1:98-2092(+)